MPSLGALKCEILLPGSIPLSEHGLKYDDSAVIVYIPTPVYSVPFSIRLWATAPIVSGLTANVYIDGTYQASHTWLPHQEDLDVTFDGSEERSKSKANSTVVKRPWRFEKLQVVNKAASTDEADEARWCGVGCIEVIILRASAKQDPRNAQRWTTGPRSLPTDNMSDREIAELASKAMKRKVRPVTGLDGANDYTDDEGYIRGARRRTRRRVEEEQVRQRDQDRGVPPGYNPNQAWYPPPPPPPLATWYIPPNTHQAPMVPPEPVPTQPTQPQFPGYQYPYVPPPIYPSYMGYPPAFQPQPQPNAGQQTRQEKPKKKEKKKVAVIHDSDSESDSDAKTAKGEYVKVDEIKELIRNLDNNKKSHKKDKDEDKDAILAALLAKLGTDHKKKIERQMEKTKSKKDELDKILDLLKEKQKEKGGKEDRNKHDKADKPKKEKTDKSKRRSKDDDGYAFKLARFFGYNETATTTSSAESSDSEPNEDITDALARLLGTASDKNKKKKKHRKSKSKTSSKKSSSKKAETVKSFKAVSLQDAFANNNNFQAFNGNNSNKSSSKKNDPWATNDNDNNNGSWGNDDKKDSDKDKTEDNTWENDNNNNNDNASEHKSETKGTSTKTSDQNVGKHRLYRSYWEDRETRKIDSSRQLQQQWAPQYGVPKGKVAASVLQQVSVGPPSKPVHKMKVKNPKCIDSFDKPYAIFRFHYRDPKVLKEKYKFKIKKLTPEEHKQMLSALPHDMLVEIAVAGVPKKNDDDGENEAENENATAGADDNWPSADNSNDNKGGNDDWPESVKPKADSSW
ncbi:hypothetical protein BT63DRAFT_450040 [Microthyrium microscopicum]|uniref:Uncharacterized protein n=1 Tax=Microthyrium microscopicum TaxID=703497 RepID=A0A6A6UUD9_9PEZI|nr:hypothetical protein BT63DRAFT_450040 [Microthyrium microscopicum]